MRSADLWKSLGPRIFAGPPGTILYVAVWVRHPRQLPAHGALLWRLPGRSTISRKRGDNEKNIEANQ